MTARRKSPRLRSWLEAPSYSLAPPLGILLLSLFSACLSADASHQAPSLKSLPSLLPFGLEENVGQLAPEVLFSARGPGYQLFVFSERLLIALRQDPDKASPLFLELSFAGGERPDVQGTGLLPGYRHYLRGDKTDLHITDVRTFDRVRFRWPSTGTTLNLEGRHGQLELSWLLPPDATETPALRLEGPLAWERDARRPSEAAILATPEAFAVLPARVQAIDVVGRQTEAGVKLSPHRLRGRPSYVLRTTLTFSGLLGGSEDDTATAMAYGPDGDLYLTGQTWSTDLPTSEGCLDSAGSSTDGWVARFDGEVLSYLTYLGGTTGGTSGYVGYDSPEDLTVDEEGRAVVTGYTYAKDFPVTQGAYRTTFVGGYTDVFVTRLEPEGDALSFSTYLGGTDNEAAEGVALSSAGEAWITGYTYSSNFPTTSGAYQTAHRGYADAFVTRFSFDGTRLQASSLLGGTAGTSGTWGDYGKAIAVDALERPVVAGHTLSADFPTTEGAWRNYKTGSYDGFVAILDASASHLEYATYLGGSGTDSLYHLALEPEGAVWLVGSTTSVDFPIAGSAPQTLFGGGGYDGWVSCLEPSLSGSGALLFSSYLGGTGADLLRAVRLDPEGRVHLGGATASSDFPVTSSALDTTYGGGSYDALYARLPAGGGALQYATFLGGSGWDYGSALAVEDDRACLTGTTQSSDFTDVEASWQTGTSSEENTDVFLFCFDDVLTREAR